MLDQNSNKSDKNWFIRHKIITGILGFFILISIISAIGGGNKNTSSSSTSTNTEETQKTSNPILAQHKVIPEDIHGTTRIIHVIVESSIKKDEIIAINDNLINDYSSGLTHLSIEYFDDEVIAADYFQKVSQVSETEAEKLFKHYIGSYTMNKTTGYNELEFNEENNWIIIKQY